MEIHIHLRRTGSGTLATVRVKSDAEILWYRLTLPPAVQLANVQRDVIQQTLAHLQRHGGPAAKLVMFQLALPAGG